MRASLLSATVLAVAASLSAQTKNYIPDGYATVEGSSSTSWPFGLSTPNQIQYLYNSSLVGSPAIVANQIAFRGQGGSATPAKAGVVVEIAMTTTAAEPATASTTFATNRGQDYTVVFTAKTVNLPAQPGTATPQPFVTAFKLDKPFPYIKANGNYLVEFTTTTAVAGAYSHDCEFLKAVVNTEKLAACGGVSQAVTGGTSTTATSLATFTLSGGPASGVGVFVIGSDLPAPVPLPVGSCKLAVLPILLLPQVLNAAGGAALPIQIPFPLRGTKFSHQWVTIDPVNNVWASSNAIETEIGGYPNATRIYNNTSATSPTGTVQFGVAVVFELTT